MTTRGISLVLALSLVALGSEARVEAQSEIPEAPALAVELRGLLGSQVGRHRFSVKASGGATLNLSGELIRPRWHLRRSRLREGKSQDLRYERYTAGDPSAKRPLRVIAREDPKADWAELAAGTPLPEPLQLPRALLEALLISAASSSESGGTKKSAVTRLNLDGYLTERIAKVFLEGRDRLEFTGNGGRASIERPTVDFHRIRCQLDGVLAGVAVQIEIALIIDRSDGILPYEDLPPEVAGALGLEVMRPGVFKTLSRSLDHYTQRAIETDIWLWFSDRHGGLGGDGIIYQLRTDSLAWTDQDGNALAPRELGLAPDDLQGAKLRWQFENLAKRGIVVLNLDLRLTINFFPVRVSVSYERGAGVHENEPAWMPVKLPSTEIGELPDGVRELRRRR